MDKFEKAMLASGCQAYLNKMNIKRYALSNATQLASAGLFVFNLVSVVSLINAVVRLMPVMWIYLTDGYDMTRAGEGFALAMTCFIVSMMSHKGANLCLKAQRRHKLPE